MDTKLKNISRSMVTKLTVFLLMVVFSSLAVTMTIGMLSNESKYGYISDADYLDSYELLYQYLGQRDYLTDLLGKESVEIMEEPGLLYYVTDGKNTITNVNNGSKTFFKSQETYFLTERQGVETSLKKPIGPSVERMNGKLITSMPKEKKIYLAYESQYVRDRVAQWDQSKHELWTGIRWIGCCGGLSVLMLVYLLFVAGKKKEEEEIHLHKIDHLWTEIGLIGLGGTTFTYTLLFFSAYNWGMDVWVPGIAHPTDLQQWSKLYMMLLMSGAAFSVMGILLLSLGRKVKAKQWIQGSFLYLAYKNLAKLFRKSNSKLKTAVVKMKVRVKRTRVKNRFSQYPFQKTIFLRMMIFIVLECFFVMLTVIFAFSGTGMWLIGMLLGMAVLLYYMEISKSIIGDMGAIVKQIQQIKEGALDAKTEILENSDLYLASKNLEDIGAGLEKSLEKSLKSERMKVDLVTNMSHDLKTPLTSIINYVDLLEEEEDLPDHVKDYIGVLSQKSNRLKTMIQDLFDLAKASSGNVKLELEQLDYAKLINQILADLSETITASELEFRIKVAKGPVTILSDGKKMYRVFQNLITNALKYSLKGTRVFVSLDLTEDNRAVISIKNTANYDMKFEDKDITERFVRGDETRSTEGSGLGLSIARSYTVACGGELRLYTNADLFIAEVWFDTL